MAKGSAKTSSGNKKVSPKKDTMSKNIGAGERMGPTSKKVPVTKTGGRAGAGGRGR